MALIVLLGLVGLGLGIAVMQQWRGGTPLTIGNLIGGVLLVLGLGSGALGVGIDLWAAVPGLGRLIFQTAIVAAMVVWFTVMAVYSKQWALWRRGCLAATVLLAGATVSWWAVSRVGNTRESLYYDGWQAHPWPVLLMNVLFGLADLAVVSGLVVGHITPLRQRRYAAVHGVVLVNLVLWSVVALEPLLIIAGTALTFAGDGPRLVIPALGVVSCLTVIIGFAVLAYPAIATWLPRLVLRWHEPAPTRITRTLERATRYFAAQFPAGNAVDDAATVGIAANGTRRYRLTSASPDDHTSPNIIGGRLRADDAAVERSATWLPHHVVAGWFARERWHVTRACVRASVGLLDVRARVVLRADAHAVRAVEVACMRQGVSLYQRAIACEVTRWLTADPAGVNPFDRTTADPHKP